MFCTSNDAFIIGIQQYAINLHTFEFTGKTTLDAFDDGGLYLKFMIVPHTPECIYNERDECYLFLTLVSEVIWA